MIPALLTLLLAQLAGEALTRATGAALPGPVAGMLLLIAAFALFPSLVEVVRPLAQGILGNLSLLFVPAGTGVIGHLDKIAAQGAPLLLALVGSTVLAIAAGALAFAAVARLMGTEPEL
ncbi:CidA/LrgA family protein [Gemmobacter fulvus]|uniref:CidA/LrgA family protein n=1 Tax=Gemmobacter fulvus TaxID=2840474 RepID=A0A975P508_9RHOB|nr:CidA/LrgA family protein [Gemmobacter fulvus]MBT9245676.1 CidA/LrgA family protein [Gemmobacter fulvus]MDQ1847109.1 CidA/LrgA family protein [Gemmobacter fulvus]QWK89472.1 CidA/LrgA family protein [Gemmobacter fulvus]